jgi:hypothetical protein
MSDRSETPVSPVLEETVFEACGKTPFPEMGVVEQVWETGPVPGDEVDAAADAPADLDFEAVPKEGQIAVGAGSRGINNLPRIVSGVILGLQEWWHEPFVFLAMGSHGGATAEGQQGKLDALGVNEETIGCEISATMDTVEVGRTPDRDIPVVADANAAAADGILPMNRIKAHTDFSGDVESGLSKMLVIGRMGFPSGSLNWRRPTSSVSSFTRSPLRPSETASGWGQPTSHTRTSSRAST